MAGQRLAAPGPGEDPRDYLLEPNFWASQTLPVGVSVDQAIRDGVMRSGGGPRLPQELGPAELIAARPMSSAVGIVDGMPITMQDLVEAHRRGDHVVDGGPGVGAFWATNIQAAPPPQDLNTSLATLEKDLARRQATTAAENEQAAVAGRQWLGPSGMAALQAAAAQGVLG